MLIVIGLLVIAVGSGLTIYGTRISSREDSGRLEKEIRATLGKIDQVKQETKSDSQNGGSANSVGKIQQIEDEFTAWAKGFMETRDAKRLQLDQSKLDRRAMEAKISARVRPYLDRALVVMRKTIDAYNERAGAKVAVELPELPTNLYQRAYKGKIVFDSEHTWDISVFSDQPPREQEPPGLFIAFVSKNTRGGSVIVSFYEDEFRIGSRGSDVPVDVAIKQTKLSQFDSVITDTICKLFEAQVLATD